MDPFEQYLRSKAQFTDDELYRIRTGATPVTLHRRQLLLREGDTCRHKIFVLSGLLRTYRVSKEALDETSVLLWPRETIDELFAAVPTFRVLSDRLREQSYNKSLQRIFANISYTAEEQYDTFVAENPEVFRRVKP